MKPVTAKGKDMAAQHLKTAHGFGKIAHIYYHGQKKLMKKTVSKQRRRAEKKETDL
jgi:hypothetical protein